MTSMGGHEPEPLDLRGVQRGPGQGGLGMAWGPGVDTAREEPPLLPAGETVVLPDEGVTIEFLATDVFEDVRAWHRTFDVPILDSPQIPPPERYALRRSLIDEEYDELRKALYDGDVAAIAKEGCDLIYVVAGLFAEMGIDGAAVWREVQRSNMSKAEPDGTVLRREDGKILKGSAYSEADVARVLGVVEP